MPTRSEETSGARAAGMAMPPNPESARAADPRLLDRCPGCGRRDFAPFAVKSTHELRTCRGCGVIAVVQAPDAAVSSDHYAHYYDRAAFDVPPVVAQALERTVRRGEPARQTGRWLDVGYGEGGLLTIAARLGWQCYGIEIVPAALTYGERQGWIVSSDPAADPRFPEGGFDVVSMVEVLEHVSHSPEFVQSAARWLRPGGLLYLTTPNANSINRRLLGARWSVVDPPDHLVLWTAKGVRSLLHAAGFRNVSLRTEGFNPFELRAKLRSPGAPEPVDRTQTGMALNATMNATPTRRALKSAINRLLTTGRLGDTLKVTAEWPAPAPRRL